MLACIFQIPRKSDVSEDGRDGTPCCPPSVHCAKTLANNALRRAMRPGSRRRRTPRWMARSAAPCVPLPPQAHNIGGWRAPPRHASRSRRRRTTRWMARSAAPCVPLPPQAHTSVDGALRRAMRPAPAAGAHLGGWRAPPRHASRSRRRRTPRWMARSAAPCVPLPPQAHSQVDGALRRAMRPAPAAGALPGGWRAPPRHAFPLPPQAHSQVDGALRRAMRSRSRRRRTLGGWRAPPRHAFPLPPQAHSSVDGALRRAMRSRSRRRRTLGGWRAPPRHAVPLPPQAHTSVDGALRRAMRPLPVPSVRARWGEPRI